MSQKEKLKEAEERPTTLQSVLKEVYGRTKFVDETASLTDYLFRNATKQNSIK